MSIRFLVVLGLSAALALATAPGSHAGAAPPVGGFDWPTFLHDGQRTGASADATFSNSNASQLVKAWSYHTGAVIAASPTVVGGTVYFGAWDGYEYALDATTGALRWKTFLGVTTALPICQPPSAGVSSAAAVYDGVLYVGGGDAYWYALDAASGSVLWNVFVGDNSAAGGHYNWSSPLIFNGFAYIGVASMGDCPLIPGQLLQVDLSTHQIVHTFSTIPGGQVGGGIWTTPAIDSSANAIFVTTGTENSPTQIYAQAIVSLDATTLAVNSSWKLPEGDAVVDSDFGNSPILFSDGSGTPLVAATNKNGLVYAFDRRNLAAGPVWQRRVAVGGTCPTCGDGSVSSGAFGNGDLFMAGGNASIGTSGFPGSVQSLNAATGSVVWQHGAPGVVIPSLAYANGLVVDGAGAYLEVLDAADGTRLYDYETDSTLYSAPSVAAGHIFVGSVAGTLYAFALPALLSTPPVDPTCPTSWVCGDVGSATPTGGQSVASAQWNVSGGGSAIGGNADAFHFVAQNVVADTQVTAQVLQVRPTTASAQTGLMQRQGWDQGAPFYALLVAGNAGLEVRYRTSIGGGTTIIPAATSGPPPLFLEIQRAGDELRAATSADGVTFTLVPGTTITLPMPRSILAGLVVSSGAAGQVNTSTFAQPTTSGLGAEPLPPQPITPCPVGWNCGSIGNPLVTGSQSLGGGTWTLQGSGTDIGGYADQLHFVSQFSSADATISARVTGQTNTSTSAKAGLMFRQDAGAASAYYGAFTTPAGTLVVQYRPSSGLRTTKLVTIAGTLPTYVEIARSGNTFSAYSSADGLSWTYIVGTSVTMPAISGQVLTGLVVTSHAPNTLSTATFDQVNVSSTAPPPPEACPAGWTCQDIGNPPVLGTQSVAGDSWTLQGAGSDIWDVWDQFHFVSRPLTADGLIRAQVSDPTNTDPWAKAGVMLRESTAPDARYYAAFVTAGNGIVVQFRTVQGLTTRQIPVAGAAPAFLQIARSGDAFSTYTSGDGTTWTYVPGTVVRLPTMGTLLAGMAITAHHPSARSTAVINAVGIDTVAPPSPLACPNNWACADIGNPIVGGAQWLTGGSWTIQGGGGDIWDIADEFHFITQALNGDGALDVRVASQTDTDPWAKSGIMMRSNADAASPYYGVFVTPAHGLAVQYRAAPGLLTQQVLAPGLVPAHLRIARAGTVFASFASSDGINWTYIPDTNVTLGSLAGALIAGLAVTSHNVTMVGTAFMDQVNLNTVTPSILHASSGGTSTTIQGALSGAAGTGYQVNLFDGATCDLSGATATLLDSINVTTDAGGAATFNRLVNQLAPVGQVIMGTAAIGNGPASTLAGCTTVVSRQCPDDTLCNGYTDAQKIALGTDPFAYCAIMRADVDGDGVVSILDITKSAKYFAQSVPPAPPRYDQDGDNTISILDLTRMAKYFLQHVSACP